MSDRPRSTIPEVAMETGGTPTSEERFQHDVDLARDAAYALEGAIGDPDSFVDRSITNDQEKLALFLEATEREARRKRLDGLCSEFGVLDRGGFETIARAEAAKITSARVGAAEGFVVMIADIGGLGRVNDALGHEAGDELIVGVAEAMHLSIRAADTLGRTTGDEFMALVPAVDEAAARGIMETGLRNRDGEKTQGVVAKIHQRVEVLRDRLKSKYGDKFPGDDPNATKGKFPGRTSLGWRFFSKEEFERRYQEYLQGKRSGEKTLFSQILMREADQEMYRQKHQGD